KLARWQGDHGDKLPMEPAIPETFNDREGDISVPLLSIADAACGEWPDRARRALQTLFGGHSGLDAEADDGILLLADIRDMFDQSSQDALSSRKICQNLADLDERRWRQWRRDRPITQIELANELRPFGITSGNVRIGDKVPKGYQRVQFTDAW